MQNQKAFDQFIGNIFDYHNSETVFRIFKIIKNAQMIPFTIFRYSGNNILHLAFISSRNIHFKQFVQLIKKLLDEGKITYNDLQKLLKHKDVSGRVPFDYAIPEDRKYFEEVCSMPSMENNMEMTTIAPPAIIDTVTIRNPSPSPSSENKFWNAAQDFFSPVFSVIQKEESQQGDNIDTLNLSSTISDSTVKPGKNTSRDFFSPFSDSTVPFEDSAKVQNGGEPDYSEPDDVNIRYKFEDDSQYWNSSGGSCWKNSGGADNVVDYKFDNYQSIEDTVESAVKSIMSKVKSGYNQLRDYLFTLDDEYYVQHGGRPKFISKKRKQTEETMKQIIEKLKQMLPKVSDEDLNFYKFGLYDMVKKEYPKLKNPDLSLKMLHIITEENIKKINIKKLKEDRGKQKEKMTKLHEQLTNKIKKDFPELTDKQVIKIKFKLDNMKKKDYDRYNTWKPIVDRLTEIIKEYDKNIIQGIVDKIKPTA